MQQDPVGAALPAFIGAPPYPRPQCRPPRRTMAGMGVMAQMFCDAGDSGTQFTPATPPHPGLDGGFCSIRSLPSACRRRVAPLMVQFPRLVAMSLAGKSRRGPRVAQLPPFGGGEAAVRGGVAPTRMPSDLRTCWCARSGWFCVQFGWVSFQWCVLALRFLRYGCIACDIRG